MPTASRWKAVCLTEDKSLGEGSKAYAESLAEQHQLSPGNSRHIVKLRASQVVDANFLKSAHFLTELLPKAKQFKVKVRKHRLR